jgi:hypothetical protein
MSGRLTSQAMITRTIVVGYTNIDISPRLSASNTFLKSIFAPESRVVWIHAPKGQEIQYNMRKAIAHGMEMSGGFMHSNYPPLCYDWLWRQVASAAAAKATRGPKDLRTGT